MVNEPLDTAGDDTAERRQVTGSEPGLLAHLTASGVLGRLARADVPPGQTPHPALRLARLAQPHQHPAVRIVQDAKGQPYQRHGIRPYRSRMRTHVVKFRTHQLARWRRRSFRGP